MTVLRKKRPAEAAKEARPDAEAVKESTVFRPTRTIGVVADDSIPFNLQKLVLSYMSQFFKEKIRGLLSLGETTLTAFSDEIAIWHKAEQIGTLRWKDAVKACGEGVLSKDEFPGFPKSTTMVNLGTQWLMVPIKNIVLVWDLQKCEFLYRIKLDEVSDKNSLSAAPGASRGDVTIISTVPTYVNKVLIGTSTGQLYLYNVKSGKRVYTFVNHDKSGKKNHVFFKSKDDLDKSPTGSKCGAITSIKASPTALDIVAIGFDSGRIALFHAREDKVLFTFEAAGAVTSLAFRSDNPAFSSLVSTCKSGREDSMAVWDLEKREILSSFPCSESAAFSRCQFIQGQPFLVVQSENYLGMLVFDTPDGKPRMLRERQGTTGKIRQMKFYGESGNELIVAADDRNCGFLGKVSMIQQHQNLRWSEKPLKKILGQDVVKQGAGMNGVLAPVTGFAFSHTRHWDWPAVVSAHKNSKTAHIWSAQLQSAAPAKLERAIPRDNPTARKKQQKVLSSGNKFSNSKYTCDDTPVSCVAVSDCGNWSVVGYADGRMQRFAVQSQGQRGEFVRLTTDAEHPGNVTPHPAHSEAVVSLGITTELDLVSSTTSESCLKIWKMKTQRHLYDIQLPAGCLFFRMHKTLIACALSNGAVVIADLISKRVVREFSTDLALKAIDLTFRADGRWLAVTTLDSRVHLFDLPSARCIDVLKFSSPVLSLAFSPNNAHFVTSHPKLQGLQVWSNKFLFNSGGEDAILLKGSGTTETNFEELDCHDSKKPLKKRRTTATTEDVDEDDEDGVTVEKEGADSATAANAILNGESLEEIFAKLDAQREELRKTAEDLGYETEEVGEGRRPLVQLSSVPATQWENILHLEEIKERNKPKKPIADTAKAPFFLPTTYEGAEAKFLSIDQADVDKVTGTTLDAQASVDFFSGGSSSGSKTSGKKNKGSKILDSSLFVAPLQKMLKDHRFDEILAHLLKQSPSGVHLALSEIGPLSGGTVDELNTMLEFFVHHLDKGHHVDLLQTYLALFLEKHASDLISYENVRAGEVLKELKSRQGTIWRPLEAQFQKTLCFLRMLTQTQTQW